LLRDYEDGPAIAPSPPSKDDAAAGGGLEAAALTG
jgi:hypothetical protein